MDRYVSPPIELPAREHEPAFSRADLVFYGVDHSGPSFEARVFLNNPDADLETPREPGAGYAGSFVVFGHGGCVGDPGHCEVPTGPRDPFDRRPQHPLTPQTKKVIVTETLRDAAGDRVTVTVVPVVRGPDGPQRTDALHFERVSINTYD